MFCSPILKDKYCVVIGKPLNVRDLPVRKVISNVEIQNIVTILGLEHGKDYSTAAARQTLRYVTLFILFHDDDLSNVIFNKVWKGDFNDRSRRRWKPYQRY